MINLQNKMKPAGFKEEKESDHVIDCLKYNTISNAQNYSSNVARYKEYYDPPLATKAYSGNYVNGQLAKLNNISHGEIKHEMTDAQYSLNPAQTTWFNTVINGIKENNYEKNKYPLESSSTKYKFSPENFNKLNYTCGEKTILGEKVSDLINCGISNEEDKANNKQTKFSNKTMDPGEQASREYNVPFEKCDRFGILSKNKTENGTNGKRGMEIPIALKEYKKEATICDKSISSWRNLYKHKLGATFDPIRSTNNLPDDYTYGITSAKDNITVCHIIHENKFDDSQNLSSDFESLIADLRKKMKVSGFRKFQEFENIMKISAQNNSGNLVSLDNFLNIIDVMKIELDKNYLKFIIDNCHENIDAENDSKFNLNINKILQLVDFSNGFHEPSNDEFKTSNQNINTSFQTSYSQYTKASQYNRLSHNKNDRVYGLPTIRYDLTPPQIKKTSDLKSYGDELNARAVLNPSVFTNWGLTTDDILKNISPNEMNNFLTNCDIEIDKEVFEKLYQNAAGASEYTNISEFLNQYREYLKS